MLCSYNRETSADEFEGIATENLLTLERLKQAQRQEYIQVNSPSLVIHRDDKHLSERLKQAQRQEYIQVNSPSLVIHCDKRLSDTHCTPLIVL